MNRHALIISIFLLTACSGTELSRDGGDLMRSEVDFLANRMITATEQAFPLLKHQYLNRYVDSLGQSIVARNTALPPLPYEFRVLKSNEVMAFSLPGGVMYVTLGLLRAVSIEGELAAAIAHELAHQQLSHQLISWRRKVNENREKKFLLDFSGVWSEHFLGKNGALYIDPGMEQEADRLAPVILFNAKFDPRIYTSYLQTLKRLETANPAGVLALNSLHPPLKDRIEWSRLILTRLPPLKDPQVSSSTFREIKAILKEAEKEGQRRAVKKSGKGKVDGETIN